MAIWENQKQEKRKQIARRPHLFKPGKHFNTNENGNGNGQKVNFIRN